MSDLKLPGSAYEMECYQIARRSGANHRALCHLIRYRFQYSGKDTDSRASSRPITVIFRKIPREPAAFLGCFTDPKQDYVMFLKSGVNRVGRNALISDFAAFPRDSRLLEARQWLIICKPNGTLVVDDHSTNGSIVIAGDNVEIPALQAPYSFSGAKAKLRHVALDWHGDIVYDLKENDVLLTQYAGFVFGRIHPEEGARF